MGISVKFGTCTATKKSNVIEMIILIYVWWPFWKKMAAISNFEGLEEQFTKRLTQTRFVASFKVYIDVS